MSHSSHGRAVPADEPRHRPEPRQVDPDAWPVLTAALAVVNRDLAATLPGQLPLVLVQPPAWDSSPAGGGLLDQVQVATADGYWHGSPVDSAESDDDPSAVLAQVADAAQETVVEALWQAWPLCPDHGIGMHPRPAGAPAGPPVWWCRGGRQGGCHEVAPVGELASAMPPPGRGGRAQRRAQRKQDRRR